MSEQTAGQPQSSNKHKKNRNQQGNRGNGSQAIPQHTREALAAQKKVDWIASKVDRASQDGYNVVQQKANDTSDTVNFLNIIDSKMVYIRMNAGISKSGIPSSAVEIFASRYAALKEEMNLLAAEMCQATGRPYRPPRGYKDPLSTNKAAAKPVKPKASTPVTELHPKKQKAAETQVAAPTPAPEETPPKAIGAAL